MRILVVGAGGFLGGHFTKRLISQGHEVTAISRRPLAYWYQTPECLHYRDDAETFTGQRLAHFQRVYYFAADVGGAGYLENSRFPSMVAAGTTLRMIEACAKYKVELVFPSSVCVYGNLTFCYEGGPRSPTAGYGEGKLFSERAIRYAVAELGLRALVFRLDNTFGPCGDYSSPRAKAPMAIAYKAKLVRTGAAEVLSVHSAPTVSRGFLSIGQVMEAVDAYAAADDWQGEPTNISCGEQTMLATLVDVAGTCPDRVTYMPEQTVGAAKREVDISRFRKITNGCKVLDHFDAPAYRDTVEAAR